MQWTLRWMRRALILLSLGLFAGVILLRLRTCRGSGDLLYTGVVGPSRTLATDWMLISAINGELLLDCGWITVPPGTALSDSGNRMELERHGPGTGFDYDVGSIVIKSSIRSMHTWWQFGYLGELPNRGGELALLVPHWFLAAVFGIPPLWSLLRLEISALRVVRRRRRGRCVKCGYDLRCTPLVCPECNTPSANRQSAVARVGFLAFPLVTISGAVILVGLGQCGANLAWRKVNFGRWTLPTMQEYAGWAAPYQPVVQAIYDYRAEHGKLPGTLMDLTPRYLLTIPDHATLDGDDLDISIGFHRPSTNLTQFVTYSFKSNDEGWKTCGSLALGPLPLPRLSASRPSLHGSQRTEMRLLELDQRIVAHPGDIQLHSGKICYLMSLGRNAAALQASQQAADACPDWWFPQMVLATLSPPSGAGASTQRLSEWADRHPSFLHYWYLSRVYRDRGQDAEALAALERGARYSLDVEADVGWNANAFACDAALYAYHQRQYQLVLSITQLWSTFAYPGDDLYAFRSAAELSLSQFTAAQADIAAAIRGQQRQANWLKNLDQLESATAAQDSSFVFDPGQPIFAWQLFPDPDPADRD